MSERASETVLRPACPELRDPFGQRPFSRRALTQIFKTDDAVKRYHLDFYVDDLDEAQATLVARGARVADPQPNPDRWRVMLDPAGHPFCICPTPES